MSDSDDMGPVSIVGLANGQRHLQPVYRGDTVPGNIRPAHIPQGAYIAESEAAEDRCNPVARTR